MVVSVVDVPAVCNWVCTCTALCVQYDRNSEVFVMIQGDVGSPVLTYSTSADGVTWQSYNPSQHSIDTNPSLPSGGSNNNPGLASMPDGSIDGMSFAGYGSSVSPGASSVAAWYCVCFNNVHCNGVFCVFGCM